MRKSIATILLICLVLLLQGQNISPRIANYKIEVSLDTEKKTLEGEQKLIWQNISTDTINELHFHLYYNAFKNEKSTFLRARSNDGLLNSSEYGWTEVLSIKDEAGIDLIGNSYHDPVDDGNESDKTVFIVPLANPIMPLGLASFDMSWQAKIPKIMPRTGYNKDFYFFAQWFPKLGVYEPAGMRYAEQGQWNCHQYHSSGEYYSDFGNYDVTMTVPADLVIASSGELISRKEVGETAVWNFRVEDVIDFTWSCSPYFEMEQRVHNGVELKFYSYPYKTHFADRYFHTLGFTMDYLNDHLGPYPYPTLSIVDAPLHGIFCGGMEYPTLISSISFCFLPKGIRVAETLVAHEYIHQYFMQLVATNETEEPWMDEGITTYYEGRIMDALYEGNSATIDVMGVKVGNAEYNRTEFFNSPNIKIAPNTRKSWEFEDGGYSVVSYNKTAIWLKTLEGLLGIEKIDEVMKEYFMRWKFKHPCKTDFTDVVNEVSGQDMHWFFDQVLEDVVSCDYAIDFIWSYQQEDAEIFTSGVIVHRLEDMQLPVEVLMKYEDGSESLEKWDGKSPSHRFNLESSSKLISAEIDPDRKIYIDKNFLNNSYTSEPLSGMKHFFNRFLINAQQALETLNILI